MDSYFSIDAFSHISRYLFSHEGIDALSASTLSLILELSYLHIGRTEADRVQYVTLTQILDYNKLVISR